ncbi:MAG: sulfite exporter TauE/SafE family protein [Verrucomicrobiota bacterium]
MTPTQIILLFASGIIAGAINAIAGGGTILTFPALMATGISGMVANATSTLALFIGTGGSMFSFRRYFAEIGHLLKRFVPVSIAGGWSGGWLLTKTDESLFENLVPILILFATILFMAQGAIAAFMRRKPGADDRAREMRLLPSLVFQFFVAVYGGYFGAGIGILMLASFGFMGMSDIHHMNALKNVQASLICMVAAVVFILTPGMIDWPRAGILAAGAVTGYFLGAHYSQKIPRQWVRRTVTAIGLLAFAVTALKRFG